MEDWKCSASWSRWQIHNCIHSHVKLHQPVCLKYTLSCQEHHKYHKHSTVPLCLLDGDWNGTLKPQHHSPKGLLLFLLCLVDLGSRGPQTHPCWTSLSLFNVERRRVRTEEQCKTKVILLYILKEEVVKSHRSSSTQSWDISESGAAVLFYRVRIPSPPPRVSSCLIGYCTGC